MTPRETMGAPESEINRKAHEEGAQAEKESDHQETYLETYSAEIETLRNDGDLIQERANAEKPYINIAESLW
ncbi:MAG: hypothetical protein AAB875_00705, partial [Patescibacteria group bacterium]